MLAPPGSAVVQITWTASPFRGDKFAAIWGPMAEAALDYGATSYAFLRSSDDRLLFNQFAAFESTLDFERYWLSEQVSEARAEATGMFSLPVVPVWHTVTGAGSRLLEQAHRG